MNSVRENVEAVVEEEDQEQDDDRQYTELYSGTDLSKV